MMSLKDDQTVQCFRKRGVEICPTIKMKSAFEQSILSNKTSIIIGHLSGALSFILPYQILSFSLIFVCL